MLRLWIVALHLRYRYFADVPIHHSRKRKERNSPVLFANWFSPYPCGLWLKELKSSWWMPLLSVNRASDHQKPSTICHLRVVFGRRTYYRLRGWHEQFRFPSLVEVVFPSSGCCSVPMPQKKNIGRAMYCSKLLYS